MEKKILIYLETIVKQMAKTMSQNQEIGDAIKNLPPVDFSSLVEKLNEVADRLDKDFPEIKIPEFPKMPEAQKIDLSEVKELLNGIKQILNKQEKPDMSELSVISSLLNKLIKSVNLQKNDNLLDKIKEEIKKLFESNKGNGEFKITEKQFKEIINELKELNEKEILIPNKQEISGNVKITNFPLTQDITGLVSVENLPANPLGIEGKGKTSISTTAVELDFNGATKSIIISADPSNTGTLYVGKSDVSSDGSNAFAYLEKGESITFDYDDSINAVYVVASIAGQYFWAGSLI